MNYNKPFFDPLASRVLFWPCFFSEKKKKKKEYKRIEIKYKSPSSIGIIWRPSGMNSIPNFLSLSPNRSKIVRFPVRLSALPLHLAARSLHLWIFTAAAFPALAQERATQRGCRGGAEQKSLAASGGSAWDDRIGTIALQVFARSLEWDYFSSSRVPLSRVGTDSTASAA